MVEEEDKNKKDESKGFAGLSSLVSDVDTSPPPAAKKEPTSTSGVSSSPPPPSAQTAPAQPQPRQQQTYQEPSQPSSGSSGGKWVLGIAAVIGVLWLIGQADKPTTSSAPTYSPPVQSATPSYSSTAQIRYCLAEDIRMDGAKAAVNNYIDADVERFNAMVADYNSRCGSFRYRRGALESARGDIEPFRSQLQAEGRSRFARPSTSALSTPAPSRPVPDATVQAIQSKLNELGYEAGTADGLVGRGTRSAIIAFQQDSGLAATGVADQALLLQLQRAPARATATATAPSTFSSPPALATTPIPQPQRPQSSGKPDLSMASPSEQAAIENACGYHKRVNGPADYYQCLRNELGKLR